MAEIEKELKILDITLSKLFEINDIGESIMLNKFQPKFFADKDVINTFGGGGMSNTNREKLEKIIAYLGEEGFINNYKSARGANCVRLKYKGLMKIAEGGFLASYFKEEKRNELNNFFWYATPRITFWSLGISVLSLILAIIVIVLKRP